MPLLKASRARRKTASRMVTTCPQCGGSFEYYSSWPRKYCSRRCAAQNVVTNLGPYNSGTSVSLTCDECSEPFTRNGFEVAKTRHHFCSRRCFGAFLARTKKGVPRPEVAGERPDLQRRVDKRCDQCGKVFRVKQSHAERRRFCSKACQARHMAETDEWSGPNNHNWKGGPIPYYGPNWRPQRRNARRRDNYTCQRCGATEEQLGKHLDVHHRVPFRQFGPDRYVEANRLANLISLCASCHTATEHEQGTRPNPVHA